MTHEDAIAAILAREQEKGVVTEAELRQQLADVTNERDEARKLVDYWSGGSMQVTGERDALQIQLKASEARNAEWAEACKALSRSVHGFNEEQWERVHALIDQSAPATDEQGARS